MGICHWTTLPLFEPALSPTPSPKLSTDPLARSSHQVSMPTMKDLLFDVTRRWLSFSVHLPHPSSNFGESGRPASPYLCLSWLVEEKRRAEGKDFEGLRRPLFAMWVRSRWANPSSKGFPPASCCSCSLASLRPALPSSTADRRLLRTGRSCL